MHASPGGTPEAAAWERPSGLPTHRGVLSHARLDVNFSQAVMTIIATRHDNPRCLEIGATGDRGDCATQSFLA